MKNKKIILTGFVILCMIVIFAFSHQNGKQSQGLSDEMAIKTLEVTSSVTKKEITAQKKESFIKNTRVLIRKSAHFFIYLVLGIFVFLTFKNYNIKHTILFSILFCFCYACSDEIHQIFVSERTARVLDVFIDTAGASIGIVVLDLLYKRKVRKLEISS